LQKKIIVGVLFKVGAKKGSENDRCFTHYLGFIKKLWTSNHPELFDSLKKID
jgi:hypothetical protein